MSKIVSVDVEKVGIKIKLDEAAFNHIYDKKFVDETDKNFVSPGRATKWLFECVTGFITKGALDKQRNTEICAADMFTFQSILYHPESLLEMQLMCTIAVILMGHLAKGTEDTHDLNP